MFRDYKTEKEKELRRLYEEYCNRWKEKKGYVVELEEPYQRGWDRFFVLRDDAKNRNDVKDLREVLKMLNYTVHCSRRNFTEKNWKTRKFEPITQVLKTIDESTYLSLSEKHRSYFVQRYIRDDKYRSKKWILRYIFKK